jgi:hypothetical protein
MSHGLISRRGPGRRAGARSPASGSRSCLRRSGRSWRRACAVRRDSRSCTRIHPGAERPWVVMSIAASLAYSLAMEASVRCTGDPLLQPCGMVDQVPRGLYLCGHFGQLNCIPWKSLRGFPNCSRRWTKARAVSSAPWARPRERAPTPMRPESRVFMKLAKPLPLVAEAVLGGDLHVLEDQLAGVGRAPAHLVFLLGGPHTPHERLELGGVAHADPVGLVAVRGFLGDDEAGDPPRALFPVRDGGDDEDLAHAGVGDEDLAAVQAIVAVLADRGGAGGGGIGAGRGLGEAEAAQDLAPASRGT